MWPLKRDHYSKCWMTDKYRLADDMVNIWGVSKYSGSCSSRVRTQSRTNGIVFGFGFLVEAVILYRYTHMKPSAGEQRHIGTTHSPGNGPVDEELPSNLAEGLLVKGHMPELTARSCGAFASFRGIFMLA